MTQTKTDQHEPDWLPPHVVRAIHTAIHETSIVVGLGAQDPEMVLDAVYEILGSEAMDYGQTELTAAIKRFL